jgi:hypothetical protein
MMMWCRRRPNFEPRWRLNIGWESDNADRLTAVGEMLVRQLVSGQRTPTNEFAPQETVSFSNADILEMFNIRRYRTWKN